MHTQTALSFVVGLVIGGLAVHFALMPEPEVNSSWADAYQLEARDEYHIHADFLVIINDTPLDFTKAEYQSTAESIKHANVHLHDEQGDVIHHHAEDITLESFFSSIGYTVTADCFTTPSGEAYCSDDTNSLTLFVNGESYEDIPKYVAQDSDRVLLYFGSLDNPKLETYLSSVTDRACIYSGTCPERGTPPPEECGLTCEL